MSFWSPLIDWAAHTGETKNVFIVHFGGALVMNAAMAIPTFLGVYFGAEPVANLVNVIPAAVTNGFNAAAGLLPAVGMALLVRMLWNSKIAIYFLLGFVCVSYLGLPMVGVAALAAVIVVVEAFNQLDLLDVKKKLQALRAGGGAVQAETQDQIEEEDFFA
jgi:PTS system mannose-specific IIC component